MLSILLNLLWKEFHELKWSVLAATAIGLTVPLCYVVRDPEMAVHSIGFTFFVYPILTAAFFGARLAAGERVSRTAPFLSAFPVRPQLVAVIKLIATSLAALAPLAVLMALGVLARFVARVPAEPDALDLIKTWTISSAITLHLLVTVGLFGIGPPTEVRAAARGLAAFLLWALAAMLSTNMAFKASNWQLDVSAPHGSRLETASPPTASGHAANALAYSIRGIGPPFDWLQAASSNEPVHDPVAPWTASRFILLPLAMTFLAAAFIARYPRALQPSLVRQRDSMWPVWMPLRLTSPLGALVWKNLREMVPMSVQVLGCSILLGLLAALVGNGSASGEERWQLGVGALAVFSCAAGFLLALLIGTGTFVSDLEPRVNTFWRSRPMSPAQWYWTKYLTGLVLLLVTLGLPAIVSTTSSLGRGIDEEFLWLIPLWLVVYSLAVTATCLVRHTVHAAVLGLGCVCLLFAAVEIFAGSSFEPGGPRAPLSTLAAVFTLAFIISTFAGCWAAVRDVKLTA